DRTLEVELYDRMFRTAVQAYPQMRRDVYIQRFRGSWQRQLDFLRQRGWKQRWSYPIYSRELDNVDSASPPNLVQATSEQLETVARLAAEDPELQDPPQPSQLGERLQAGWLEAESFGLLPEYGAFALEVRQPWAEVKFFCAAGDTAVDAVLNAASAKAKQAGASEIYFTLEPEEAGRMRQLTQRGYKQTDAGVYLVYELSRS
ncbi:MAG: hypothetical protein ACYS7M_15405, partial [Planctomycetota bacterium]